MLTRSTPAKINLFLNLRGVRDDGYHEIYSVMQTIGIYDRLQVEIGGNREKIKLTTNHRGLQVNNIVVTTYHRFWQATGKAPVELKVHLEKSIPVEAGMGGGSSDAAAMLLLLDELAGTHLSVRDLEAIAATLGSDVPFFIRGGTAIATGRGESIDPLDIRCRPLPLLVVKPRSLGISTAIAYQLYRSRNQYQAVDPSALLALLKESRPLTPQALEPLLINDFENVLFDHHPALVKMTAMLKDLGIGRPFLSGSGPSMIGFLPSTADDAPRQAVVQAFPASRYELFLTETLPMPGQAPSVAHPY